MIQAINIPEIRLSFNSKFYIPIRQQAFSSVVSPHKNAFEQAYSKSFSYRILFREFKLYPGYVGASTLLKHNYFKTPKTRRNLK